MKMMIRKLSELLILSNAQCQIFFFHTNSGPFLVEIIQPCVLEEVRNDDAKKRNSRKRMVKGEKKTIIYREVRREWSNITDGAGQWLINLCLSKALPFSLLPGL